eukprot:symbB.v1.2.036862.t2/scaffold5299.1/size28666/1
MRRASNSQTTGEEQWPQDVGPVRSVRSLWRYPSKPSSMPDYMRRAFRTKCFALGTLQLSCVFVLKTIVDHYRPWHEILDYGQWAYARQQIFFYATGIGTLACIAAMQCLREQYPWNYVMMAMTTLLSGFFWGMMRAVVLTSMHFQILGILIVTMGIATVLSQQSFRFVTMPLFRLLAPGWFVGSCTFATYAWLEDPDQRILYASTGLSMLLLIILAADAGKYLMACKPDDFMKVIVSINSTLMVVVSIPFFVVSFCFIHANEAWPQKGANEFTRISPTAMTEEATSAEMPPSPAAPEAAPAAPAPRENRSEEVERDLEEGRVNRETVEEADFTEREVERSQERSTH